MHHWVSYHVLFSDAEVVSLTLNFKLRASRAIFGLTPIFRPVRLEWAYQVMTLQVIRAHEVPYNIKVASGGG
jgi:hypothetical protein